MNCHMLSPAVENPTYKGETGYTNQRSWRRFLARMIDLNLLGSISLFVVGLLASRVTAFEETTNTAVNTLIFVFLGTLAEGTVFGLFGQTPGKALARIHVSTLGRTRLSLAQAISRSWEIWIHGLGLGLPIVSLIALYFADRRVAKDGTASWDKGKYVVSFDAVGPLHFCALVVTWGVSVLLSIAVSAGIFSDHGANNEALDTVAKRVAAKVEWRATTDTCPAELMRAPEAQVSKGLAACKRQVMRCLSRCEDGDGPACQLLALMLQESKPEAGAHEPLFQQACKAGFIPGCTNHAAALLEDRNSWVCATKTFEQGCQYEDPWACTMFASNLARGVGTTKDLTKALKALEKSCKNGEDDPACKTGMQLKHNIEDAQDKAKRSGR
jgi:uncharacterized RDD family membrane protein YckC